MLRQRRRPLKNAVAEIEQFRRRALLAFVLVLAALAGLAAWYFRLQVLEHRDYATRSEANRIRLQPVVPGRGLIYDRKGQVLADNVPAFRLEVVPEQAGDPARWLPALREVVAIDDEEVERFHAERRAVRGFRPVTLKLRVGPEDAARFAVDRWRFPGVELVSYLNRRYPNADLLAHVVGYVARTDEDDLARLGPAGRAFSHSGKTGLERYYEDALRGALGQQQVETNVEGVRSAPSAGSRPRPAPTCGSRSTWTCSGRWSPPSARPKVRRWRWIRRPDRSWRWSACLPTTRTCSSTASRIRTTAR